MTINGKRTIQDLLMSAMKTLSLNEEISSPRLDSEILLAHALNCKRIDLIVHHDKLIDKDTQSIFLSYINRRIRQEPISYITNSKEFMSLDFFVDTGILIPRPETEMLVEYIISQYKNSKNVSVLDLCTGSGAIAVSAAVYLEHAHITAIDKYDVCIAVAERNARRHKCLERITLIQADVLKYLQLEKKFHCIVSNPPYIKKDILPTLLKDVIQYEPIYALEGGSDGLIFYHAITSFASNHLHPSGQLVFEIGYDQGEAVKKILLENGSFHAITVTKDIAGNDRMVTAIRKDF